MIEGRSGILATAKPGQRPLRRRRDQADLAVVGGDLGIGGRVIVRVGRVIGPRAGQVDVAAVDPLDGAVVAGQPQFAPLAAGEIVTTGTITDAWPVVAGETWSSNYGALGLDGLTLTFV